MLNAISEYCLSLAVFVTSFVVWFSNRSLHKRITLQRDFMLHQNEIHFRRLTELADLESSMQARIEAEVAAYISRMGE